VMFERAHSPQAVAKVMTRKTRNRFLALN